MSLLMLAALAHAATAKPAEGRHATALLGVRVQVVQTCVVSPAAARCNGSASARPLAVRTSGSAVKVFEF